jgi:hypothetical protein
LINKDVYIYDKNNNIIKINLLYFDYSNSNIYNLKYLYDTFDYVTIMYYYYSYIYINDDNFLILENTTPKTFKYTLFDNDELNDEYINIYINFIKSIINIISNKDIIDESGRNIIINNSEFNLPLSDSVIFDIKDIIDMDVFRYYNLYLKTLYIEYEYYNIVINFDILNNEYYKFITKLLNGYNIGLTSGNIINMVNSSNNFNLNRIIDENHFGYIDNRFNIRVNNLEFYNVFDKKITNIDNINNTLDNIYDDIKLSIDKYKINRNVLNIQSIQKNNSISKYDNKNLKLYLNNIIFKDNKFTENFILNDIINQNNINYINPETIKNLINNRFTKSYDNSIDNINDSLSIYKNKINNYFKLYLFDNSFVNYNMTQNNMLNLSNLHYLIYKYDITYYDLELFFKRKMELNVKSKIIYKIIPYLYLNFDDNNIYINDKDIFIDEYNINLMNI